MKIVAPKRTAITPVRPSAALRSWYFGQLKYLLWCMANSLELHIAAAWKSDPPPSPLAQDASSTLVMKRAMTKWGTRWVSKFDAMSGEIAKKFADKSKRYIDTSNAAAFKKAGFTVQFKPTEAMKEAYNQVVAWNVGLIKNLPRTYLDGIQDIVYAGVMKGADLNSINEGLRKRYDMSLRRAALITKDQVSKSRAAMNEARHTELGITHGIWQHSHAVRHPRTSHQAFSGKVFDLQKGAYLDGVWTKPGIEINCQCYYRPIIPGFNDAEIAKAKREAVSSEA